MPFAAIGAAVGVASAAFGFAGSQKQASSEKKAIKNQNKAAKQQYRFDKREIDRTNKYNKESLAISKDNYYNQRNYEIQSQNLEWQDKQYIRDFSYNEQVKAYNKSEQNYSQQISFNNLAAAQAFTSSQQGLKEFEIGQAFEKQDVNLQAMQDAGSAQTGQAGNNLRSSLQSISASKGRDLAVMNANLRSKVQQTSSDMADTSLAYMGANMQAEANRMLLPQEMDPYNRPLTPPERIFQDVYEAKIGPEPTDGIYTGAGIWGSLGTAASQLAGVNWSGITKPSGK